jgi:hypothetical protein
MPPVHGRPVTLRHGWEQLHTRVSTTGVRNKLSHIRGPITAYLVVQARTMLLYVSGQVARTSRVVRVSVAPRARRVPRSRFHHQQVGVVFHLPVTDLQFFDELENSLITGMAPAKGHREYGLHCTAELEWLLIVSIDQPARRANLSSDSLNGLLFLHSSLP